MGSEVTAADREKAAEIVANWSLHFGPDDLDPLRAMVETYLADERAKARVPFLIRARECELQAEVHDTLGNRETARAFRVCVQRIRRAAEVGET